MRVSASKDDRAYYGVTGVEITKVRIFLDGEQVFGAITADEESGEVLRYRRKPDGKIACDASNMPLTETVRGTVKIVTLA